MGHGLPREHFFLSFDSSGCLHIQEALEKGLKDREVQVVLLAWCQHHHQARRKLGIQEGVKTWPICSKEAWLLKCRELPILIRCCQVLLQPWNREKKSICTYSPPNKERIFSWSMCICPKVEGMESVRALIEQWRFFVLGLREPH